MIKIGVLSSYNGSGFDALYEAINNKVLDAEIVVVLSNNTDANVLKNAKKRAIPNFLVNKKVFPDINLDEQITSILVNYACDYVFLAGFMKKIEKNLLKTFPNKIVNSHPALLPKFGGVGMYGRFVHEAVVKNSEEKTGVTIHFVNENYDEGEYILQKSLEIKENESVLSVETRVKELETKAIVEAFINLSS